MTARKILVDCMAGIDDLLALIYGILSPEVDVISVTLPNHDTLETVKSALALLDVHQVTGSNETPQRHSGRRSFKGNGTVISVATNTAAPTDVPPETLLLQHNLKFSKGSIGSLLAKFQPQPSGITKSQSNVAIAAAAAATVSSGNCFFVESERNATEEMLHQLESHPPRTISFVMLGPLTNLAQAIKLNPSAVGRVHNIFIMGGCISHPTPGGNVTECAEFNFYADPEAAAVVMESGLPITLVPLDVTETCRLRYTTYKDTIVPLANKSPLPAFATTFLHEMFDILASQQHRPREIPSVFDKHLSLLELSNEVVAKKKPISTEQLIETTENQTRHSSHSISLAMHDPLCMGIVIDPSVVQKTLSTVVKVETHADAITRGMSVVDGRRWKIKPTVEEERTESLVCRSHESLAADSEVEIVMRADVNQFFGSFMNTMFGISWDSGKHAWSSDA